jgi:hypothetical protein
LFDCFWQSAHLAVSLAHSFFAASHWSFVHFSTCVGIEAFDESVADVAGDGLVAGGDAEVCAIAALDRTAARNAAVRQKLIRDIGVSFWKIKNHGSFEKALFYFIKSLNPPAEIRVDLRQEPQERNRSCLCRGPPWHSTAAV